MTNFLPPGIIKYVSRGLAPILIWLAIGWLSLSLLLPIIVAVIEESISIERVMIISYLLFGVFLFVGIACWLFGSTSQQADIEYKIQPIRDSLYRCPFCASKIPIQSVWCPNCRYKIPGK